MLLGDRSRRNSAMSVLPPSCPHLNKDRLNRIIDRGQENVLLAGRNFLTALLELFGNRDFIPLLNLRKSAGNLGDNEKSTDNVVLKCEM
jgi:hypothetical protein